METELHAAIDIGTNTVLLLVASKNGKGLEPLREEQRIPRLGKGVDASGNLSDASIDRVIEALKEYSEILNTDFPNIKTLSVTATSAVRDAANRNYFIKKVKDESGFSIRVLSGTEEAELTFLGALSMIPDTDIATVIDIGGGSTEIAYGKKEQLLDSHSFNMGSVRYTERFIKSDPPKKEQVISCRNEIKKILHTRPFHLDQDKGRLNLIGVAGTVTSLAYIDLNLSSYDIEKINGYRLSRRDIKEWVAKISMTKVSTLEERYPQVMKGRAEVILAGLLILDEFMDYYGITEVMVSTGGIRHGAILAEH